MKKLFLFAAFVSLYTITDAQIILANPAVTNNVAEIKTVATKIIAFRISPFSYPMKLLANAPSETGTLLTLTVKEFDLANNISGNSFIVPENGIYHFDLRLSFSFPITDYAHYDRFYLMLNKNGNLLERTVLMNPQTAKFPFHTMAISTTIMLMKGDAITTSYNAEANEGEKYISVSNASFSGFKVSMMDDVVTSSGTIR